MRKCSRRPHALIWALRVYALVRRMLHPISQTITGSAWTLRAIGDLVDVPANLRGVTVPAVVPGCVHVDLIRAGLIDDPAVGMNENFVQWIGLNDWEYALRFDVDAALLAHQRVDLVGDGLDTIATLSLNDQQIGTAANMFYPHRFDVRRQIRAADNQLLITFRSPLRHIRQEAARLGLRPVNGDWEPFNFIRKAACNFGWDWAPRLATCGIWRDIRLEGWSAVRIDGVRPLVCREEQHRWRVDVQVDLEWSAASGPADELRLEAAIDRSNAPRQSSVEILRHGAS